MNWVKAALVGALGSLVMFIFMVLGIHVTGMAPFNIPPSAAFLEVIGLRIGPLPLLVHFGYGMFWSAVFYGLFRSRMSIAKGLGLAGGLWLFMMLVYSPIIGWGFFGFGNASTLAADAPLHLEAGPKYLVVTAVLHVVYGLIIGGLNPLWIETESGPEQPAEDKEREPSLQT